MPWLLPFGLTIWRAITHPFARSLAADTVVPMHRKSAMIHGVQVAGNKYVVYGPRRGFVSTHRHKKEAYKSLANDSHRCQKEGNPSDALVYAWVDNGWAIVVEEES